LGAAALLSCALALGAHPAWPQDKTDDVLEGFDDEAEETAPVKQAAPVDRRWRLGGSLSQEAAYNYVHKAPAVGDTDHRGLSGLRTRLNLAFDSRLGGDWKTRLTAHAHRDFAYLHHGRRNFTSGLLQAYESEAEIDEFFVAGPLAANVDLRTGRQIVVWGKSDNIRITDVLNPLDLRAPGRTDIEDLRLPVTMTRLDYYIGDWNLSAVAVHEARYHKIPLPGSDYYRSSTALPLERKPSRALNDQEFGLALNGVFPGWDFSAYAAYHYDDAPHLDLTGPISLRRHSRLRMLGVAGNLVAGSWLWKGEAALIDGFEFSTNAGEKFSRIDALAGVEYTGFDDTTLSLETANRHFTRFPAALKSAPEGPLRNDVQSVLRLTRNFLNETLEVTALASTFGATGQNGAVQRLQVNYDIADGIEVTGGIINYLSGKKSNFDGIGRNDRVFLEVTAHF